MATDSDLDQGKMHWFGEDWGSWICRACRHVPTPVGEACFWCDEPIAAGERGVTQLCLQRDEGPTRRPMHLDCHLRSTLGGVNHILGRCLCCGGDQPADPPGLSRREAARLAASAHRRLHPHGRADG